MSVEVGEDCPLFISRNSELPRRLRMNFANSTPARDCPWRRDSDARVYYATLGFAGHCRWNQAGCAPTIAGFVGQLRAIQLGCAEPFLHFGARKVESGGSDEVIKDIPVVLGERVTGNVGEVIVVEQEFAERL